MFDPRDGELVRAADHVAAFMEAYLAVKNGIKNQELICAVSHIKQKYKNISLGGISLNALFADF